MKLKPEDTKKPFTFLQAIIHLVSRINKGDTIELGFKNQNIKQLLTSGDLKFITMQHRHSFITTTQAISKIVGEFSRINTTVNSTNQLFKAAFKSIAVINHLKYRKNEIKTALIKMMEKEDCFSNTWGTIYHLFNITTKRNGSFTQ